MYPWLTNPRSAYIHIPFCHQKCGYCDFNSYSGVESKIPAYIDQLEAEINMQARFWHQTLSEPLDSLQTVYFGGGTPSILKGEQVDRILTALNKNFGIDKDAEITLEANPGATVLKEIPLFKKAGINRLSIGLQAIQPKLLRLMNRIHTVKEFDEVVAKARSVNIDNLSGDLMIGLPQQTLADVEASVGHLINLGLPHVSVYSLIIEEGTRFYNIYGPNGYNKDLPSDHDERLQNQLVQDMLTANGFIQYEISNFGKENYFSRHNLTYWHGNTYYGFGAGAHFFVNGMRRGSKLAIKKYIETIASNNILSMENIDTVYPLDEIVDYDAAVLEFFMLGLRCLEGVNVKQFRKIFGREMPAKVLMKLSALCHQKLLIKEGDVYRLSPLGLDLGNLVFREFV